MCLAIPMQLLETAGEEGVVARGEVRQRICMALLPEAEAGDYVLVHAGYAIARVDREEAEQTRRILAELLSAEDDDLAAREAEGRGEGRGDDQGQGKGKGQGAGKGPSGEEGNSPTGDQGDRTRGEP